MSDGFQHFGVALGKLSTAVSLVTEKVLEVQATLQSTHREVTAPVEDEPPVEHVFNLPVRDVEALAMLEEQLVSDEAIRAFVSIIMGTVMHRKSM